MLLEHGAVPDDPVALPVLLNDPEALAAMARATPACLAHRVTMRLGVHAAHGRVVAARGRRVRPCRSGAPRSSRSAPTSNDRAAVDADGLGGHTPLFHTVNAHANRSAPVMRLLLAAGAAADARVDGLVWGRGFEWETDALRPHARVATRNWGPCRRCTGDERDIADTVRAAAGGGRPAGAADAQRAEPLPARTGRLRTIAVRERLADARQAVLPLLWS